MDFQYKCLHDLVEIKERQQIMWIVRNEFFSSTKYLMNSSPPQLHKVPRIYFSWKFSPWIVKHSTAFTSFEHTLTGCWPICPRAAQANGCQTIIAWRRSLEPAARRCVSLLLSSRLHPEYIMPITTIPLHLRGKATTCHPTEHGQLVDPSCCQGNR